MAYNPTKYGYFMRLYHIQLNQKSELRFIVYSKIDSNSAITVCRHDTIVSKTAIRNNCTIYNEI